MREVDLVIVGAGPVGLMSAFLAQKCGLSTVIIDKSEEPLQVGRADALNGRTLQLLEIAGIFDELYPLGKPCNTSSVWKDGAFQSRQSHWWEALEGCFHKHFLMLGQSFIENLLDEKLTQLNEGVIRKTEVKDIEVQNESCITTFSTGEKVKSKYVIGSDGSRSLVRELFKVPFEITRPQITWAVIDAEFKTDFEKVPEIIVFQTDTSDVAWIPREGTIDRFYVRMDRKDFTLEEAMEKVRRALAPHSMEIEKLVWFSQFSVKESVAERFIVQDRVFLAGDSSHIHSVNGGQGLNTGLSDAFNLIWKIGSVLKHNAPKELLRSYENERKPVALSVVETSGKLVRSTKYSETGTHADDYVKLVEKLSGNITGMGIGYSDDEFIGQRVHDFEVMNDGNNLRLYNLLDYSKYTLVVRAKLSETPSLRDNVKLLEIAAEGTKYTSSSNKYLNQAILVRPDGYIAKIGEISDIANMVESLYDV